MIEACSCVLIILKASSLFIDLIGKTIDLISKIKEFLTGEKK